MATAVPDPNRCPICGYSMPQPFVPRDVPSPLRCPNCGNHLLSRVAFDDLPGIVRQGSRRQALLGHGVRKVPADVPITTELIAALLAQTKLPPAMERIDNLVLYLAADFAPGEATELHSPKLLAMLGAASEGEARWVVRQAQHLNYIAGTNVRSYLDDGVPKLLGATLTVEGWKRHAELQRDGAGSRHAFMAMRFGDPELTRVFETGMQPAVAQTGFELRTVAGDHKTAGSIDNRMRVEIRTSRFVVCDLTHGNRGAYWEGGFAEGLGRPVFYTCRRDVLQDRAHADHPHFDTAHQLIIAWDSANLAPGMQELKDVIRATLPAEARMNDG